MKMKIKIKALISLQNGYEYWNTMFRCELFDILNTLISKTKKKKTDLK